MTTGPTYGAVKVAKERARQIDVEGYTPEHDADHTTDQLVRAAKAYLGERDAWPWSPEFFKPQRPLWQYHEADLIKAGALIAATIDQLNGGIEAELWPKPLDQVHTEAEIAAGLAAEAAQDNFVARVLPNATGGWTINLVELHGESFGNRRDGVRFHSQQLHTKYLVETEWFGGPSINEEATRKQAQFMLGKLREAVKALAREGFDVR